MKNYFRAPRLFLPRGGFEKWAVPAADSHSRDRDFWERVARNVGNAPSSLRCILPELYVKDGEDVIENAAASIADALAEEKLERVGRGFILTRRTLKNGAVRMGIVAALDLEYYSFERGEITPVRATEAPSHRTDVLQKFRSKTLIEFPHCMLFYKDKKNRLKKMMEGADLETLYDFPLMEEGGNLKGSYIPADCAPEIAAEMASRGEPCFAVADGHDELAAAKMYWESLKPKLKGAELKNHPARFALAECVNLYDPAVELLPVHRFITDTEFAPFIDYFTKNIKCRRENNMLFCELAGIEGVRRADKVIGAYLYANGGRVTYVESGEEMKSLGEGVGVLFAAPEKEDLFYDLKSGELMPRHTFTLGQENRRYCLEGREISYD